MPAQILIVEDEPLLALAMGEQLREGGFAVAGVAPTVARALALLTLTDCDAAILDCKLRNESVEQLAEALADRGIPFLFYTGGDVHDLPERFKSRPLLKKPAGAEVFLDTVRELVVKRHDAQA